VNSNHREDHSLFTYHPFDSALLRFGAGLFTFYLSLSFRPRFFRLVIGDK